MRLRTLADPDHLPALDLNVAHARPALSLGTNDPPPRILLLYGSLRERSFSRFTVDEAARLLRFFGAETRIFDPSDLPLPDQVKGDDHPPVHELRQLSLWSEGQVWCSPERHGQITGLPLGAPISPARPAGCERTNSGLARAKTSGEKLGRPKALNDKRAAAARAALQAGATVSAVAKQFETSRQTIMRVRDTAVEKRDASEVELRINGG